MAGGGDPLTGWFNRPLQAAVGPRRLRQRAAQRRPAAGRSTTGTWRSSRTSRSADSAGVPVPRRDLQCAERGPVQGHRSHGACSTRSGVQTNATFGTALGHHHADRAAAVDPAVGAVHVLERLYETHRVDRSRAAGFAVVMAVRSALSPSARRQPFVRSPEPFAGSSRGPAVSTRPKRNAWSGFARRSTASSSTGASTRFRPASGTASARRARRVGDAPLGRAGEGVREARARFNPVKFNADEWVKLAKDAGMKYIVITSKHHDGFALFKSAASPYNIVDATPFKRDVLKELADACARGGIRLGFYYSQSQDWHEPNGAGNDLGLRSRRQEGLRPVPARQGGAAGAASCSPTTARSR